MGCYLSKNRHRESNARMFRVFNIDDHGAELSLGKIEVTENDLILYQKGKEPIRWPLRCLRRYGFDEQLFSFESGRRCPTGSGIYAFKSRKAEDLFNFVQEAIQNVGQNAHLRASQTMVNGTSLPVTRGASRPTSQVDPHEPSGIRLSGTGRVAVVPFNPHLYMNSSSIPQEEACPNYVNTAATSATSRAEPIDEATALIDFLHDPPMAPPPPKKQEPLVTYADLDLPRSTDNIFAACEGATGPTVQQPTEVNIEVTRASCSGSSCQEGLDVDDINAECADPDVFEDAHPNYINIDVDSRTKEKTGVVNAAAGAASADVKTGNDAANVPPTARRPLERKLSIQQEYENVGAGSFTSFPETPVVVPNGQNGISGNSINALKRQSSPGELNYIEIDVNKTESDNVQGATAAPVMSVSFTVPDSPSKKTGSYAMIDFNRTEALSNSAKIMRENEEGLRKTRHNSTIN